jgi:hypothetical protein
MEVSHLGTPISDVDTTHGWKGKKGNGKAPDYKLNTGSKRKHGVKSMSATSSVNEDDEEEPDQVSPTWFYYIFASFHKSPGETTEDQVKQQRASR